MGTTCSSTMEDANVDPGSSFVDVVAGNDADFSDGQMVEVKVDGAACLLIKDGAQYHALSGKCTHYGASLAKGSFNPELGLVRCPWHGACFNVATGDIEDFPGLDSLHRHEASVDKEGQVHVRVVKQASGESTTRRKRAAIERDLDNGNIVAVIGGGGSAQALVETLRQECNYDGRLVIFSEENDAPYDRPKLSKALSSTAKELALRPPAFYKESCIEFFPNSRVVKVDTEKKELHFSKGSPFRFDQLVIASGSTPRSLSAPKADLENIFTLRTPNDANAIVDKAAAQDVVVVGSSFISMEVAAALVAKAKSVTVIGSSSVPFKKSLGEEIGMFFKGLHESKGVQFEMGTSVQAFEGDQAVSSVLLANGKTLPASLVVLGIGVTPNTDFLVDSSITLTDRGFVPVNEFMETEVNGIFAVGDIAAFPLSFMNGKQVSIGHWQLAHAHGRTAALNISGRKDAMKSVPFFWTQQFGKSLRFAGYSEGTADIEIVGNVEEGEFVAYFCQDDKVCAVATLMRDPVAADFANLLRSGQTLTKQDIHTQWNDAARAK